MIMDKYRVLRDYFGHTSFRDGQENIIDNILSGRDVLGIMPTGAGKSMCYQIPALMFDGITIVVSPLISLMKDQVNSLIQSGVRAAYLNSSLSASQFETAVTNARKGMYKIIYVAPERLCTQGFLSISKYVKISMVAVDEAHCVSQWGQDFRPSYMKIPEFLEKLPYRPVVGAFTATATAQVRDDIIKMLSLRNPFCLTTGFDRKNLYFGVIHPKDKYAEVKRIVEENKDKCGVIYCSTRKNVEMVCDKLNADGYSCTRYHAGLPDEERRSNQDDFIFDRKRIIVATNAFGMGIDKSNVSYVIHYNMPKNIESYYQEAGRAGRDGAEAKCILLYSPQDVRTNMFLIENSNDNPDLDEETQLELRKKDIQRLKAMTGYCTATDCLREYILRYFGEKPMSFCSNCSNCNTNFEEVDVTIEAQKILSCVYRLHQRNLHFGSTVIAQILQGADNAKMAQFNLKTLSTYGIMKDCTQVKIRQITAFLENGGYLTEGEFNTLTLTAKSKEILIDKQTVKMKIAKETSKNDMRGRETSDGVYAIDTALFERLKNLRASIARDIKMPAYIIFTDQTLRDMCLKMPKNSAQMLEVSGVGKAKQDKYGRFFIKEIKDYLAEHPEAEKSAESGNYLKKFFEGQSNEQGLFALIKAKKNEFKPVNEELTLSQLADEILSQLGVAADKKSLKNAMKDWLVNENYLGEKVINGRRELTTTILSSEAGIIEVKKISQLNREFTAIVFPKPAQEFIFENIDEILIDK